MPTDLEPTIETTHFAPTRLELWNLYNRLAIRRSWVAMLTVSVAGGAVVAMSQPVPDPRQGMIFSAITLLAVFLLVPVVHWQRLGGKAQRNLYAPRKLFFTASALQAENHEGAKSETPYGTFWRSSATIDGFLLYLSKGSFIFVPYRAFTSPADITAVRNRLRERRLIK